MLPEIFRADDPVLQVPLAREDQLRLEELLDGLAEMFTADDSLGWTYQFWQGNGEERSKRLQIRLARVNYRPLRNCSPRTTWWISCSTTPSARGGSADAFPEGMSGAPLKTDARTRCALPGVEWTYSSVHRSDYRAAGRRPRAVVRWLAAIGTRDPHLLDPCMGSGHFLVFALPILVGDSPG